MRAGTDGEELARGAASEGHGVLVVYVGGAEERPLRLASLGVVDRFPRPRRLVLRAAGSRGMVLSGGARIHPKLLVHRR